MTKTNNLYWHWNDFSSRCNKVPRSDNSYSRSKTRAKREKWTITGELMAFFTRNMSECEGWHARGEIAAAALQESYTCLKEDQKRSKPSSLI